MTLSKNKLLQGTFAQKVSVKL